MILILFQSFKHFCGVAIEANSLFLNFFWTIRFAVIQTSVCCLPVVSLVICQKGYLMMTGVLAPTPISR